MTLEEFFNRIDDFKDKRKELTTEIHNNYLDTDENKLMYKRWYDTKNLEYRHKVIKKINNGKKEWEPLLELYPEPDKLFSFTDVRDENLRKSLELLDDMESEEHKLFVTMFDKFKSPEERKRIKEHLFSGLGI